MSLPHEFLQEDQQMVSYLLGLLPDEAADRLEEATIVDNEVAARLRTVEDDLVDAYVSGTLDRDTRESFESFYLASPRRREKVEFAQRFLSAVDRAPVPPSALPPPSEAREIRRFAARPQTISRAASRATRAWPLAVAALLVLGCGALLLQDIRLRQELNEVQRDGVALNHRAESLAKELDDERAASIDAQKALDRIQATTPVVTTALVLLPQTRSTTPVSTIAVAPGTELVAFDLRLEVNDFDRYLVALKDPATNRIVWRSDTLTPSPSRRPLTISVALPASVLKAQHYSLDLTGSRSTGASESVGSYVFQVEVR
jgi:anti-sigma factor RsiW